MVKPIIDHSLPGRWWVGSKGYVEGIVDGRRWKQHRYIMSQHIGAEIPLSAHVHHLNHIKHDNRICNLQILEISAHRKLHFDHLLPYRPLGTAAMLKHIAQHGAWNKNTAEVMTVTCAFCGAPFSRLAREHRNAIRRGFIPHCSRSCSSKHLNQRQAAKARGEA